MRSVFLQVDRAALSTRVQSPAWTATSPGVLEADCEITRNGVLVGAYTTFASGDSLRLRAYSSGQLDTSTTYNYTLNGRPGVWCITTVFGSRPPLQVDVGDPLGAGLPGDLVQTAPYVVPSLLEPAQAVIPDQFNGTLVLNGQPVGVSHAVTTGDVIYARYTLPDMPGLVLALPIFIGRSSAVFRTSVVSVDRTPTDFSFNHTQAAVGTALTSNAITVSGLADGENVQLIGYNCGVILNGQQTATPATCANGDVVQLSAVAPSRGGRTTYASVQIGTTYRSWRITSTRRAADYIVADSQLAVVPHTVEYTPQPAAYRATVGASTVTFGAAAPTGGTADQYVAVAVPQEDKVYVLDYKTGATLRVISLAGAPTGGCGSYDIDDKTSAWVSLNELGQIVKLNLATGAELQRVTVGAGPLGIDATDDYVVVARTGAVTMVPKAGGANIDLPISGALDVLRVASSEVWVTSFTGNKVYRVAGTAVTASFDVPQGPVSATLIDKTIWVACANANSVWAYDTVGATATVYEVLAQPIGVSYDSTAGAVVVSHLGTPKEIRFTGTGRVRSEVEASLASAASNLHDVRWVVDLTDGRPSQVVDLPIPVLPESASYLATDLQANLQLAGEITVADGRTYTVVSSAPAGSTVEPAQVTSTAELEANLLTSSEYVTRNELRVSVLDVETVLEATTTVDRVPAPMFFAGQRDMLIGETRVTEEQELAGLTPGVSVTLSSGASILVNGSAYDGTPVTNGARISLVVTAVRPYGSSTFWGIRADEAAFGGAWTYTVWPESAVHYQAGTEREAESDWLLVHTQEEHAVESVASQVSSNSVTAGAPPAIGRASSSLSAAGPTAELVSPKPLDAPLAKGAQAVAHVAVYELGSAADAVHNREYSSAVTLEATAVAPRSFLEYAATWVVPARAAVHTSAATAYESVQRTELAQGSEYALREGQPSLEAEATWEVPTHVEYKFIRVFEVGTRSPAQLVDPQYDVPARDAERSNSAAFALGETTTLEVEAYAELLRPVDPPTFESWPYVAETRTAGVDIKAEAQPSTWSAYDFEARACVHQRAGERSINSAAQVFGRSERSINSSAQVFGRSEVLEGEPGWVYVQREARTAAMPAAELPIRVVGSRDGVYGLLASHEALTQGEEYDIGEFVIYEIAGGWCWRLEVHASECGQPSGVWPIAGYLGGG